MVLSGRIIRSIRLNFSKKLFYLLICQYSIRTSNTQSPLSNDRSVKKNLRFHFPLRFTVRSSNKYFTIHMYALIIYLTDKSFVLFLKTIYGIIHILRKKKFWKYHVIFWGRVKQEPVWFKKNLSSQVKSHCLEISDLLLLPRTWTCFVLTIVSQFQPLIYSLQMAILKFYLSISHDFVCSIVK